MKKRMLSFGLALLLLLAILPGTAFADNTIIANLGTAEAGKPLDQLIGTTDAGTAQLVGGTLPQGCQIVTEQRDNGALHYLRGNPLVAGQYEFTLAVTVETGTAEEGSPEDGGAENKTTTTTTLTCSLNITPATPAIAAMEDLAVSVGDNASLTATASVADGGTLSYQWYSNTSRDNQNGTLVAGATAPTLALTTASIGTTYYYCVVTNTNGGLTVSARSAAVAVAAAVPELTAISVNVMPAKRQYAVGDTLDTAGLQLLLRYSNGSTKTVDSGFEAEPKTLNAAGTQSVVIRYEGLSCTYPVLVEEAAEELRAITLTSLPAKREYRVGDWLDTSGIVLKVETNKGSYEVTSGFACTPRILEHEGEQTITVSYGALSAAFTVKVSPAEKTVESISVLRRPTKLSYAVGDTFDPSGMTLSVVTSEGTEEVSTGFTCAPTKLSSAGTQTITISYMGKTCTFDLVVAAKATETPKPEESAKPEETAEPTPTPAVTPKPDIRPERKSSHLGLIIVIAAAVALAALLAYVYVMRQERILALWEKLRGFVKSLLEKKE